MKDNPPPSRLHRFALSSHRRVGLASLACAVIGAGWLSSVVLPGLQKSGDKKSATMVGAFGIPIWFASKSAVVPSPSPQSFGAESDAAKDTVEASFVAAPTGIALHSILAAARFGSMASPAITGTVTYASGGTPKPFWDVVGQIVGAAPAPGVKIEQGFDQYRIFPRNVVVQRGQMDAFLPPVEVPIVPLGEGGITHRMAGYISLTPNRDGVPVRVALVETRIPGMAPLYRVVRVGDLFSRKSAEETANALNPATNVDVAPVVEIIEPNQITLRGGGDKTLRIPLGATGVPDIFGMSPDVSAIGSRDEGQPFAPDYRKVDEP